MPTSNHYNKFVPAINIIMRIMIINRIVMTSQKLIIRNKDHFAV